MENTRMPELKALAREQRLRGYSWLRKAELIAFFRIMNIRPRDDRDLHHHPHRGTQWGPIGALGSLWDPQHLLHGCLLSWYP